MKKVALIFGITGQDGSHWQNYYWKKYIVHGKKRRSSSLNTSRIDHIFQDPQGKNYNPRLHYGDITDTLSVSNIIKKQTKWNLQFSCTVHVAVSFEVQIYS